MECLQKHESAAAVCGWDGLHEAGDSAIVLEKTAQKRNVASGLTGGQGDDVLMGSSPVLVTH
jgi:hypothetical protein